MSSRAGTWFERIGFVPDRCVYLSRFELWAYGVADVRLLQVKTFSNTAFPRRWFGGGK